MWVWLGIATLAFGIALANVFGLGGSLAGVFVALGVALAAFAATAFVLSRHRR